MSKKSIIDLKSKNIRYEEKNKTIKLLTFNKSKLTIEIAIYEKENFIENRTIVFAHLPKSIKSLLKPI
ncbi:MAG: malate dehydrogenase [Arcobacter sp.]|nr:malate dehydrogenase [Arcobacter sp.]